MTMTCAKFRDTLLRQRQLNKLSPWPFDGGIQFALNPDRLTHAYTTLSETWLTR